MKLNKPITLIGLMGSGKTTIGIALANRLGVPFIDSDREIEARAGATIAEVFDRDGEPFFRKVEAKTIDEILSAGEPCVLATGGGAFMNLATQEAISKHSTSIWLRANLETLMARLDKNDTRPLLKGGNKRQTLEKLMSERYSTYEKADIIIDSDGNSRMIVVDKIIQSLEERF